jgi:hypothetical protein
VSQGRRANNCRMDKRDLIRVECSAVMALYLTVKNTSTVFFWSSGSLGFLVCDILGPSEGSTPLRASSSKSMRSASLSPYVNNLNYVENTPTCTISIRTSVRENAPTYLPRILRSFAKLRPNAGGLACRPIGPSGSPLLCLESHLEVIIH